MKFFCLFLQLGREQADSKQSCSKTSHNTLNKVYLPYHGPQEPTCPGLCPPFQSQLHHFPSCTQLRPCLECPSSGTMHGSLLPGLRPLLKYLLFQGVFSGHPAYSFSMSLPCFIFAQSIINVRNYMMYVWVYKFIGYLPNLSHVNPWAQEPALFLSSPESLCHWMNQTNEASIFHFPRKTCV